MNKFFLALSTLVLVFLAGLLGWLVFYTEGLSVVGERLEWAQFIGRFHPVILHLPIGIFLGLFVVELFALKSRSAGSERSAHVLVWLMALTSVLTAYLGLLLASNGDYAGDTLWWHKWLGIIFAATALLVAFLKVLSVSYAGKGTVLYRLLMLGLFLLLPVVGHFGGELTHGAGYLTRHAPEWLKTILAEADQVAETDEVSATVAIKDNVYSHQIQPILDQYCVSCHGMEKQKSKYRLDTYEYLLTPGTMGDTPIEPYSISESILLEYLWLPESDDMAMPPEGKPRPSAEQILALTHWVAMGAAGPPVDEAVLAAEKAAVEAEKINIEGLFDAGVILQPVGLGSELFYLDFQNADDVLSDDTLEMLTAYKDRIEEIKFTGRDSASSLLERLRGAEALRVLNLNGLQNADAIVAFLNSFKAVEALHLFGSGLSQAGLDKLSAFSLRRLYLGETNVTPGQIASYAQANPTIQIYGNVDMAEVEVIEITDLENTAEFKPEKKK